MAIDLSSGNRVHYGDIAALDTASAVTVVLWGNPDTFAAAANLIAKQAVGAAPSFMIAHTITAGLVSFSIGTGPDAAATGTSTNPLVIGSWSSIALRFEGGATGNGGRLRGWLNGVEETLSYSGTVPAVTGANAGALTIGARSDGSVAFNGKDSDLKIWTAALSPEEIVQEMFIRRPYRTANLLLWVPFDDGTSWTDYGPNKFTPTTTGTPAQVAGPPVSYGAVPLIL